MLRPEDALEELRRNANAEPAPPPVAPPPLETAPPPEFEAAPPPEFETFPAPTPAPAPAPAPVPVPVPRDEDDSIGANISASYFELRRNMMILALIFPLVLMALGGLGEVQGSLSAYYHHDIRGTRTVFTGVLWAVGAFLVFYKGYSDGENIALNIAGVGALAVSLFPMDWPEDAAATISGRVHYISAAIFFLAIAYVCIFRYNDTLQLMKDEARRAAFANSYRVIGALMVLLPLGIFAIFQIAPRAADAQGFPVILAVEAVGIWVFAAFWLTKSKEIALLEKQ